MCTHQKWIKNPYTKHSVLVKCGHCKACQQEKANHRMSRIKANTPDGYINLFVTLTYKNAYLPYVLKSDVMAMKNHYLNNKFSFSYELPIYRDFGRRLLRTSSDYSTSFKDVPLSEPISKVLFFEEHEPQNCDKHLHPVTHHPGRVSVVFYKDVQDFFKRLRINLERKYNYTGKFTSFQCAELGSHTFRAHFHLLLTIPSQDEEIFRSAVVESWPYADSRRTREFIQVARDAASYVASYINRGSQFPPLLAHSALCPRCSYSKNYGLARSQFSLSSLLEKAAKNDLSYSVERIVQGAPVIVNLLMPKYVCSRFFPKFKGYCRLSSNQIRELLLDPKRYAAYCRQLDLSRDDIHKMKVSVNNAYKRFCDTLGLMDSILSRTKYATSFIDVWNARTTTSLRKFYANTDGVPTLLLYDNWMVHLYRNGKSSSFILSELANNPKLAAYDNPNDFPLNVLRSNNLAELYDTKQKTKCVTNYIIGNKYDL